MSSTQIAIDAFLDAVAASEEDLVDLARRLVQIPTINPPGDGYRDICELLTTRLEHSGFNCRLIRAEGALGDSDRYPRWNLIARKSGRNDGPCVHFNSHHDVVATGSGWSVDPFAAEIIGRRLYGRGACDMKGGLAASIIAAEAFVRVFPAYSGHIEISATADEESGGYAGVAYLAERGWFAPDRVHHVIIPEPLNKDRICLGHRGVWWAEIETVGSIAHGSMPFLGDCAVRHMGAVIAEMERALFPALAARQTDMPIVPVGARASTLNINSLHGGLGEPEAGYTGWPSALVPDSCRMIIDRRFLLEEDLPTVKLEMREILDRVSTARNGFRYELRDLHEVLPTMTERDAPVVQSVDRAIRHVLGKAPEYVVSPGTYDQKHIDRIGHMKNCIAYGPGIIELAHQPDEYVDIDDMLDSVRVMGLALIDLLPTQ